MVMCPADTTLEPALHKQLSDDGRVLNTVTGVGAQYAILDCYTRALTFPLGITHRCKDWGQIWHYVEDNYHRYQAIRKPDTMS